MKTSAKCTLADMILAYIGEVEGESDDLKEDDMEDDDIFKEPKSSGKPKIVVKSMKAAPKKG